MELGTEFLSAVVLLILVVDPFGNVMHLSEASLSIAGGVILFLIAIRMVFGNPQQIFGEQVQGEPFIVPLAVPFIAGPSALATSRDS